MPPPMMLMPIIQRQRRAHDARGQGAGARARAAGASGTSDSTLAGAGRPPSTPSPVTISRASALLAVGLVRLGDRAAAGLDLLDRLLAERARRSGRRRCRGPSASSASVRCPSRRTTSTPSASSAPKSSGLRWSHSEKAGEKSSLSQPSSIPSAADHADVGGGLEGPRSMPIIAAERRSATADLQVGRVADRLGNPEHDRRLLVGRSSCRRSASRRCEWRIVPFSPPGSAPWAAPFDSQARRGSAATRCAASRRRCRR